MTYEDEDTIDSLQEVFRKIDRLSNNLSDIERHLEAVLPPHMRKGLERRIEAVAEAIDDLGIEVDDLLEELEPEEK